MKQPATYIIASNRNDTIYTGVTSNLVQRVYQHREGLISRLYQAIRLQDAGVVRACGAMEHAIAREQQIKGGSRTAKMKLIKAGNLGFLDLYPTIV